MYLFARHRLPSARRLLVGACVLSLTAGCVAGADGAAEQTAPADETTSSGPTSSTRTTRPSPSTTVAHRRALEVSAQPVDSNTLAAELTIDAAMPVAVEVTATARDHVVTTPRTAAENTSHVLPLVGLRSNRDYTVDVAAFDADGAPVDTATTTVATGGLPEFVADYELAIATPEMQPGLTLVEVIPSGSTVGHLLAIDPDGHVVWYHQPPSTLGAVSINEAGNFTAVSFPFGYAEFDVLGATVSEWVFAQSESSDDSDAMTLDVPWSVGSNRPDAQVHTAHHDVVELPSGNLLVLARVTHDVSADLRAASCPNDDRDWSVASDVVVEFEPDGTVVRTWNVADAIDIESNPGTHLCADGGLFATDLERDWSHANAVEYDAVGDLVLVSIRHTDSIVAFEHPDAIGHHTEVAWILGAGGTIEIDGEPFFHQHAPQVLDDGSLLVYDNGNDRPGGEPYSRAVIYDLAVDEADVSATATQTWEHRVDDVDGTPLYAQFLGDADQLANGNVLITHGGIGQPLSDDQRARIIEVAPDDGGDIVFDLYFGVGEAGATAYRADRIDTLYNGVLWADSAT